MPRTLRPTGLSSPAYADKLDYVVCEDGKVIGRIYEGWHTLPDPHWFWSITVYVDPKQGLGATTAGVGERTDCSARAYKLPQKGV